MRFARANFALVPIHRTNLHSKGFAYWQRWLRSRPTHQIGGRAFTLLHFDSHSDSDVASDGLRSCSPTQLLAYHQLLEAFLDSVDEVLIALNLSSSENVTQRVLELGFIDSVVWAFPDHWATFNRSFVAKVDYHRFRRLIANLTFFLTPIGDDEYVWSFSADGLDEHDIAFLESNRSSSLKLSAQSGADYDSAHSLRFRICAVTLSELQSSANELIPAHNAILVDFDLDVLVCASPSETLKAHFGWGDKEMIATLNAHLTHHRYAPSHLHIEDVHYAMLTLLFQLSRNESNAMLHAQSAPPPPRKDLDFDENPFAPRIADVMEHALEHQIGADELRALLYHFYRFWLEVDVGDTEANVTRIQTAEFIAAHTRLDRAVAESQKMQPLPLIDHFREHQRIAQQIAMRNDTEEIEEEVRNVSVDALAEVADSAFESTEPASFADRDLMEEWTRIRAKGHSVQSHVEMADAHAQQRLLLNLERDGSLGALTPSLWQNIQNNKTYDARYWRTRILQSNKAVIRGDEHAQFVDSLRRQFGLDDAQSASKEMTYPEALDRLQLSGDYLYASADTDSEMDETAPTRVLDDWSEDDVDALTARNLSTILAWHSLNDEEQHFLRQSNHSQLRHFISALGEKQKTFLDWLIFCALLGHRCEDGHSPLDLIDADAHPLRNVDWSAIDELPAIIASERHREALQIATAFHGKAHGHEAEAEWQFLPSRDAIAHNLQTVHAIVRGHAHRVMVAGIELSHAHTPRELHEWLDCAVSVSLLDALQIDSFQFARFQTAEGDEKVWHWAECHEMESALYLMDKFI